MEICHENANLTNRGLKRQVIMVDTIVHVAGQIFSSTRCDWLRSSRVSIASGFSPRFAYTQTQSSGGAT